MRRKHLARWKKRNQINKSKGALTNQKTSDDEMKESVPKMMGSVAVAAGSAQTVINSLEKATTASRAAAATRALIAASNYLENFCIALRWLLGVSFAIPPYGGA